MQVIVSLSKIQSVGLLVFEIFNGC